MRTIENKITLYKLSELDEKAQQRAYHIWLNHKLWELKLANLGELNAFCKEMRVRCDEWTCNEYVYHVGSLEIEPKYRDMSDNRLERHLRISFSNLVENYTVTVRPILQPILDFLQNQDNETNYQALVNDCLCAFFKECSQKLGDETSCDFYAKLSKKSGFEYLVDGAIY